MTLIKSISGIRGTIGGTIGSNLTPIDIVKFTSAFVTLIKMNHQNSLTFIVGRDARISGGIVNQLVCATLQSMGVHVIDLGLSTTPTVEMAVIQQKADGGIILTASHNPMQWNALKLLNNKGEFISAEEGQLLLQIADKDEFTYSSVKELGIYTCYEKAIDDHIDAILKLDLVDPKAIKKANFSVAIDAVNSTGGIAIPKLLNRLGVNNITVLYGEPNGVFPHNPEPLPEHLTEISEVIKKGDFHIGFVVDPDVDRLALVMENGEMFGEEYTLVAVADYVLQNKKGNTVSNLSSSRALRDISEKHGVNYYAAAVGEVNVVEMMKQCNAVVGGEGNGGIILPELHYGRDALVGIALFLTSMAKSNLTCSEIRSQYPEYYISKNKIELSPEMNISAILNGIAEKYTQHDVNLTDGVKINFPDNWVHLRASNTEPIIRIYAEAYTMAVAENLAKKIMGDIAEFVKDTK